MFDSETPQVQHLNPDTLNRNPAFTNVVVVTGPVKTIYVGGQDAVDAAGQIVGKGDIRAQAEQVFKNLQAALEAAGASLENVIKWNILDCAGAIAAGGVRGFSAACGDADRIRLRSRGCLWRDWRIPNS